MINMEKDATLLVRADAVSRLNALNGKYKAGNFGLGVDLGGSDYIKESPERIRRRADLADKLIAQALLLGRLYPSLTNEGEEILSRARRSVEIEFFRSNPGNPRESASWVWYIRGYDSESISQRAFCRTLYRLHRPTNHLRPYVCEREAGHYPRADSHALPARPFGRIHGLHLFLPADTHVCGWAKARGAGTFHEDARGVRRHHWHCCHYRLLHLTEGGGCPVDVIENAGLFRLRILAVFIVVPKEKALTVHVE